VTTATDGARAAGLGRLLSPRHVAVFGSAAAAEVVRQCRKLGFEGDIWPVHPLHQTVEGLRCYPDVAALPTAPDASFIAVPREATVEVVAQLAARGAGGAVCYASGFAEVGGAGIELQAQLVRGAGAMPVLGPNCYGMLNYLDGVALWPDQHGGERLKRGVAIVTQSGNIGLNLTMQRRALPLAYLITVGNKAGSSMESIVAALLQDERVSAIGLHIEGLDDVTAFSRVARKALQQKVPLVALKSGSSALGAQTTMSHTSSLAGPDVLYDTLFARFGIARVFDPASLLETLKLLHVHGGLRGRRIISASCSGGEASLVADLAQPRGLEMPALPASAQRRLHAVLGDKVSVTNPLDYHTYIWGDATAQTACFAGLFDCEFDMHLLVLDFPRADRCDVDAWQTTVDAFVAAHATCSAAAGVVASLPEGLPDDVSRQLLAHGIAPMQGIAECLDAIAHAASIGAAQSRAAEIRALLALPPVGALHYGELLSEPGDSGGHASESTQMLDEAASKQALAAFGVPVPKGAVVSAAEAATYADSLGYPVVVKAVSTTLAHKTDAGAVRLNLGNAQEVGAAAIAMSGLSDRFLVERMAADVVAEIIVGVQRDAQFGLALTLGAGGIFVELLKDVATLLLPVSRVDVRHALESLRTWPLLTGFRARAAGDIEALLDAVMSIAAYALANADRLRELDVNPLLVLAQGRGVLAVDAVITLAREG
jgi:acyl-CoA synthetase (NDP forming)